MNQYKVSYTSELMKNFKQAEIMAPEANIMALQTDCGCSLLFSLGTDHRFYVTQESPGHATGWQRTDLSASLGIGKGVQCRHFSVAQEAKDGSISLALVLRVGQRDKLYVSLGNPNGNTAWIDNIQWKEVPWDAKGQQESDVTIVDVMITEAFSGKQYIVADLLRDPDSSVHLISRYYVDPDASGQPAWNPHNLSIDLEAEEYDSCIGRQKGQRVDGIYTIGSVGSSGQFIYQPLFNVWNPSIPASPARLALPGNRKPESIAACRTPDGSTDLYVTSGGNLYHFAPDAQKDGDQGCLIASHPLFGSVKRLFAVTNHNITSVWGLNGSNEIFYISCAPDAVSEPSRWSHPVPILKGVDQVSPYVNRVDHGNTFFAVAGDQLHKAVQSPETSTWRFQNIMLPAPVDVRAQTLNSYTTRVQVTGPDNQPLANQEVALGSGTRTSVYINHLYYVLDTSPVRVKTDALGSVTIVDAVESLHGTELFVDDPSGKRLHINPMDKPFGKAASLDTRDKLQAATITSPHGDKRKLIPDGTDAGLLDKVATGNANLQQAYRSLPSGAEGLKARAIQPHKALVESQTVSGIGDAISVAAGDLFRWLESGVESVIQIVEDAATATWHFIADIGGKLYSAVLDTVETVIGAVEWVYNAIKVALKDLMAFLEFLFDWKDITRTKAVLKNLARLYLNEQVETIDTVKHEFNQLIESAEKTINNWAGVTDWKGLGEAGSRSVGTGSKPTAHLSASSTLLSHHFQNNAGNISPKSPIPPATDPGSSPVDTLWHALTSEADIISQMIEQFSHLGQGLGSRPLDEILKKSVAILADGALSSVENVVDALFDLLAEMATAAIKVLDTPIHIPVVSDILAHFGVPELSFLDLFCWVAAVPVTLTYKLAADRPLFADNRETRFLMEAKHFQDVRRALAGEYSDNTALARNFARPADYRPGPLAMASGQGSLQAGPVPMSEDTQSAVFIAGHAFSGFFTLMSDFVTPFEVMEESGDNPFAIPSAILGILSGVSDGLATTLVPKDPIDNAAVSGINTATLGIRILCKVIFSGPGQSFLGNRTSVIGKLKVADGRGVGAIVDAALVIPALVCTCWHFYELSEKPAGATRSIAIIEETASIMAYVSRIGYAAAANDPDPESKAVEVVVLEVANLLYSGLQTSETVIH